MEFFQKLPFIYQHIMAYMLIMSRIMSVLGTFFVFRRDMATPRIIISLGLILSFYVLMLAPQNLAISHYDSISAYYFELMGLQLLLGFIGGIILNITFEIFYILGQFVSTQMGLSIASLIDLRFGYITSLSHFYIITSIIIFFYLNGHLFILDAMVTSFNQVPLFDVTISQDLLQKVMVYSAIMFSGGMKLSFAMVMTLMITNITIGIITKFSPQINLLSIGLNLELIIGLIMVYLTYELVIVHSEVILNMMLTTFGGFFGDVIHVR